MELSVKDRLYLPTFLPARGNFKEFNLKKEILRKIAIGDEERKVINLRENARKQSHLRQAEKPYGKEIYYGGYLAGVQQELADHPMSFSFTEGNSYEE